MYTTKQIAKLLNIGVSNVSTIAYKSGIKPSLDYTEQQLDIIKANCYKYQRSLGKKSIADIAKDTGLSRQYIYRVARAKGYIKKSTASKGRANLLTIHEAKELLNDLQK